MGPDVSALASLAAELTSLVEQLEADHAAGQPITQRAAHELHDLRKRAESLLREPA